MASALMLPVPRAFDNVPVDPRATAPVTLEHSAAGIRPSSAGAVPAAHWPRQERSQQRLLVIDVENSRLSDRRLTDLVSLSSPGDVLVFNDAATLPASLTAVSERGEHFEIRLARQRGQEFWAVVLGHGDWRSSTEARGQPPRLALGERLRFGATPVFGDDAAFELSARVTNLAPLGTPEALASPLLAFRFEQTGTALWDALYRLGRPIQYSHIERPLELWHVQNVFAARPWAFELASAAHGFSWQLLLALKKRGVELCTLTHAAGLSSTGSAWLDRELPFPERYEVPAATVECVTRARRLGHRVVAVGTTVVRALESAAASGRLVAGPGEARLVLGPRSKHPGYRDERRGRVVDSVLSGIHQPGESHYSLLEAFAPSALLARAARHALGAGYLAHEFGDACLVF